MDNLGIYIHVPFCDSKCNYCNFYSLVGQQNLIDRYTDKLCDEIDRRFKEYPSSCDTIYFGGGTPSMLGVENIEKVISKLSQTFSKGVTPDITTELNPTSVDENMLFKLKEFGVNRLSFGVQSGIDLELEILGRTHRIREVENIVKTAHQLGFADISLDLMLGIPNQTLDSLNRSIDFLLSLNPSHISAYILKIEEKTNFYKNREKLNLPDDDLCADLYLNMIEKLGDNGLSQYEISNFSKPGFESKHNLKYWKLDPYLGFGPSAHSFDGKKRFYNEDSLERYLQSVEMSVEDGEGGTFEEFVMLKLRLKSGLNLAELESKFPNAKPITDKIPALVKNKLLEFENDTISLTPNGCLVSNSVICQILS